MSDNLISKAKLIRAYQNLQASSESYDRGCMEIKELLDLLTNDKIYKKSNIPNSQAKVYSEQEMKLAKIGLLDDVLDMLNKEAHDPNLDGVYRWYVPLQVAADEIDLLKDKINGMD